MAFYRRILGVALLLSLVCTALPAVALNLISPTDMQVVRENVAITISADALPDGGFLSLYVSQDTIGSDSFTVALSPDKAIRKGNRVTFYWNSKSAVRSEAKPKEDRILKDGIYNVRVNVHSDESKIKDYTSIKIDLRNKIVRPSPAPGVLLNNKLVLNQTSIYDVKAIAQVYSDQDTPILGGLNLAASMSVYQTVEDIWPDGSRLLKYKLGKDTYVTSMGALTYLYPNPATRPQLYKLVHANGNVVNQNVFARQKQFSVMDLLPVLPNRKVKEGDSWNDRMRFKVDGVTENLTLTGKAVLDSFEWEQGKQCAKVISNLTSESKISLLSGKLTSDAGKINAKVVSYIAYKESKCIRRDIVIDFAALIQQGLEGSGGMGMGAPGYGEGAVGGPGGVIAPGGPGMMGPGAGGGMPGMMGPGGGAGMPGMMGPGGGAGMPGMMGPGAGAPGGAGMPGMMGPGTGMGMPGMMRPNAAADGAERPAGMPGMPGMPGGPGAAGAATPGTGMGMPGMMMPGMGTGAGMPGMPGMGAGSGSGTLSLNNAEKGSIQIKVNILLKK